MSRQRKPVARTVNRVGKTGELAPVKELTTDNVVMTGFFGNEIDDLPHLALALCGSYTVAPNSFLVVNLNCKAPKCKVGIFVSGKVVFTGAESEQSAMLVAFMILEKLRTLFPAKNYHIRDLIVQNVVGSKATGYYIDLKQYNKLYPGCTDYLPESFSGLHVRMPNNITALCFTTGSVVLTGGKCLNDLMEAEPKLNLEDAKTSKKPDSSKPRANKIDEEGIVSVGRGRGRGRGRGGKSRAGRPPAAKRAKALDTGTDNWV